jgi:predicted ATPase
LRDRRQQSKFFELWAAVGLGRLRLLQGWPDDARTLVQDVYDRFDQGFDTHDLKEAKSLLEKLS